MKSTFAIWEAGVVGSTIPTRFSRRARDRSWPPGAGELGLQITVAGTYDEMLAAHKSLTGPLPQ